MARPIVCDRCGEDILPQGNERPYRGKTYHAACYDILHAEKPKAFPEWQIIQKEIDGDREPRL